MTTYPDIAVMKVNEGFNIYAVYEHCDVPGITEIPAGFFTDFASVPRIFWPLIPPQGEAQPPSVVHDYFYTVHPKSDEMTMEEERLFADNLFRDQLIERGISKWQVNIMYRMVRLFGKYRFEHYGKSRKRVRLEKRLEEK